MEFLLNDPEVKRVPPEQTRLLELHADPYPDGGRLRIALEMTPFEKRPYLELTLKDADGNEAASASIVEPMGWKLELTLHIRKAKPAVGKYTLIASLAYPDLGEVDRREISVDIQAPTA